jgi:S1 RNA binding domain protein
MSTVEVGAKLEGKVTGITHFGAFIELEGGVTGLVHISEIADTYVKEVKEHLKLEDTVTVKVINVDANGKIGLSIKKAIEKPVVEEQRPSGAFRKEMPREGFRERSGSGGGFSKGGPDRKSGFSGVNRLSFEDKVSRFLKDSEERITSLKKNTEGKRGGRGARRG